jgi:hypothetical protein
LSEVGDGVGEALRIPEQGASRHEHVGSDCGWTVDGRGTDAAVDLQVDVVAVDVVVDVSEAGGPLPPEQAPASSTTTMAAPAAAPTLVMCPGVARG